MAMYPSLYRIYWKTLVTSIGLNRQHLINYDSLHKYLKTCKKRWKFENCFKSRQLTF